MKTPDPSEHLWPSPSGATFKTPERQRQHSRNYYRRKKGIPLDLPRYARDEPMNRPRRGTGNIARKVRMPREAWDRVKALKGKRTMGETIATALELLELTE